MLSLAPLRYSRVLQKHGGPIERLDYGELLLQGHRHYHANAQLSRHLNLGKGVHQLFTNADGSGTHASAMVARHMAISEALERWAFHYINQEGKRKPYGFTEDGTTSGMAAFPGMSTRPARELARLEAEERYCLVHWWNRWLAHEEIPANLPGTGAIRIHNPLSNAAVVLCWRSAACGWIGYGTGAARQERKAAWKAVIELERSILAMEHFHRENASFGQDDLPALSNHLERRLMHYALPEGHATFLNRLARDSFPNIAQVPKPIVDREIPGPWSRYATVWRVLYPTHSREHLDPGRMTFFW